MTNNYVQMINDTLDGYLESHYPDILFDAVRYSVFAGGKRVRGVLTLMSAAALGGDSAKAMPFACALEMIHAYSLIHDDLPAMDDDDYRRGKLTNHKVYGDAMAILSGDALLNKAFEVMGKHCEDHFDLSFIKAMNIISNASGVCGMIGGQVMDILSEGKEVPCEILDYIYENKTAALFKAAMKAGAVLSGAVEKEVESFEKAGYYLGIAFQIKDDLLDTESSFEALGKPIGSDEKNNKNTYISMYGLERAKADYEKYSLESINILLSLNLENKDIIDYVKSLLNRSN